MKTTQPIDATPKAGVLTVCSLSHEKLYSRHKLMVPIALHDTDPHRPCSTVWDTSRGGGGGHSGDCSTNLLPLSMVVIISGMASTLLM